MWAKSISPQRHFEYKFIDAGSVQNLYIIWIILGQGLQNLSFPYTKYAYHSGKEGVFILIGCPSQRIVYSYMEKQPTKTVATYKSLAYLSMIRH